MCRTGLSNDSPNMPSITIWCDKPDAEREPAAARGLHRERLLRHRQRMAAVGRDDAGRELDARDLAADDREHAHRVEPEDLRTARRSRIRPARPLARRRRRRRCVRPAVSPPKFPICMRAPSAPAARLPARLTDRAGRLYTCRPYADVAQLVEHNLAKVGVAGSNPVVRSKSSW